MSTCSINIGPFPNAVPGEIYQLVSLGALERQAHTPRETFISAYFRLTDWEQDPYQPLGNPIIRKLNIHQGSSLQVGSLWRAMTGEMIASSKVRLRITQPFRLLPGTLEPHKLSDILSDLTLTAPAKLTNFLSKRVLSSLSGTPFVTVQHRSTTIIISCLELARAFYFWAGPRIVDFFFYPGDIQDICHPVVSPTERNRRSARLLLHARNAMPALNDLPRHFSKVQVAILAELLFNPSFKKSFAQVRKKLTDRWRTSPSALAHLWLQLTLEKVVRVEANGFSFTHNERSYFWVTSLLNRSNYFCFNKLEYTAIDDHRPGRTQATADFHAKLDRLRAYAEVRTQPTPVQDSNQAGSSLYGTPQVPLPTDDDVDLPKIERTAKVLKDMVYEATYRHVYGHPNNLSERGGGRDLNIAKVFFQLEVDKVTYAWYFRAMVAELQRTREVRCLEINNENHELGPGVCVLRSLKYSPYLVGVAEISYQGRFFYLFQVLASRSKRWALLFMAKNQAPLAPGQVNDLMLFIRAAKDNWVTVRKTYGERLNKGFADVLTIMAHNHKGIRADVKDCQNDMRRQFQTKAD